MPTTQNVLYLTFYKSSIFETITNQNLLKKFKFEK